MIHPSFSPVHHFSPHYHISANMLQDGSPPTVSAARSSLAFPPQLPKSLPSRSTSSCPSAGQVPRREGDSSQILGLNKGHLVKQRKRQRLLVLHQKLGAACGWGFRMVEMKQHYLISLATETGGHSSLPLDMGSLNQWLRGWVQSTELKQNTQDTSYPHDSTGSAVAPKQPEIK